MKNLLIFLVGVLFYAIFTMQSSAQANTDESGYADVDTTVTCIGLNGVDQVSHVINVYGMDSKIKYQQVYYDDGHEEIHTSNLHIKDLNLRMSYNTFLNITTNLKEVSPELECVYFNDFLKVDGQDTISIQNFKKIIKGVSLNQSRDANLNNSLWFILTGKKSVACLMYSSVITSSFIFIMGFFNYRKKRIRPGDTS